MHTAFTFTQSAASHEQNKPPPPPPLACSDAPDTQLASRPGSPLAKPAVVAAQQTWQHPALKHQLALAGSGGSGAKPLARGAWTPHLPLGKLAVLLALLAGGCPGLGAAVSGLCCTQGTPDGHQLRQQQARAAAGSPMCFAKVNPAWISPACPALPPCPAGVVASDMLKLQVPCPSLSYWLRATSMVPVTLAALFAVRWGLLGGAGWGGTARSACASAVLMLLLAAPGSVGSNSRSPSQPSRGPSLPLRPLRACCSIRRGAKRQRRTAHACE